MQCIDTKRKKVKISKKEDTKKQVNRIDLGEDKVRLCDYARFLAHKYILWILFRKTMLHDMARIYS